MNCPKCGKPYLIKETRDGPELKKMTGWNVYLNGKWVNKVFFVETETKEQILKSLINHDGFDSSIAIKKERVVKNEMS